VTDYCLLRHTTHLSRPSPPFPPPFLESFSIFLGIINFFFGKENVVLFRSFIHFVVGGGVENKTMGNTKNEGGHE
jgi:hypothetical protein